MRDTGPVAVHSPVEVVETKRKHGRETAADMVRSLGLIMLVVVPVWFFAQPPASDEATIRLVDPVPQITAWRGAVPGAPAPEGLPDRWRTTVARYDSAPDRLRLGHVTPAEQYAEFAASTGPADEWVAQLTGEAPVVGTVDVDGTSWTQHREADGSLSLVRRDGNVTVVVGTLRSTASLEELRVLAAAVRPG